MAKTVWILGSGFSKPLGGPLLRDLFRQEYPEEVETFFRAKRYPELAQTMPWVQRYFHAGAKQGLWENAEQYLAYVDDAYAGAETKRQRLAVLIDGTVLPKQEFPAGRMFPVPRELEDGGQAEMCASLSTRVTRALAAECYRFLLENHPQSESWLPYREWVRHLDPDVDTVLTFNYDLVIENAARAAEVDRRIWVAMPADRDLSTGTVPVLKLHGSVDWRVVGLPGTAGERVDEQRVDGESILRSPTDRIGIAAPGGSKARFVEKYLEPLWKRAEAALGQADRLMIVGYSFPDTDPAAELRLLRAFEGGAPPLRRAHVVMGAEMTAASTRVLALLGSTAKGAAVEITDVAESAGGRSDRFLNIVRHPLGTQDFIGRSVAFDCLL